MHNRSKTISRKGQIGGTQQGEASVNKQEETGSEVIGLTRHKHTHICMYIYVYMYIYIYMFAYISVNPIYLSIYLHK